MQEARREQAQAYRRRRQKRKIWRNVVRVMACIVVFCTTYALILPAITMEKEAFCGIEAHTHKDGCYVQNVITVCDPTGGTELPVIHTHDDFCYDGETLICTLPELEGHVHADACYTQVTHEAHTHGEDCYAPVRGALLCEIPEEEGHTHTDACYVPGENLTCTETEREGHTHGDACYTCSSELTCTTEEGEGHTHGADCYITENKLICKTEETEGHTHSDSCYVSKAQLACDTEETAGHSHGDQCYTEVSKLTCSKKESQGHAHGADCVDAEGNLICEIPESEGHSHSGDCYTKEKKLTCEKKEKAAHTHSDSCYIQAQTLGCGLSEVPAHAHGAECYKEEKTLKCKTPEKPAHTHGAECYTETKTLHCEIPEDPGHTHTGSCYEQVLGCGLEEKEGHTHSDACYEMVPSLVCTMEERAQSVTETVKNCTLSQIAPHVHNDGCKDADGNLKCTIVNAAVHQHTKECLSKTEAVLECELEEHKHTLSCFSDPNADKETKADWEAMIAKLELTGNKREDVLIVAKSQLGYNESEKNYIVLDDGETMKGYTRYGGWYGVPYGDWCAMYASFCLHYAKVPNVPLNSNCNNWIGELKERNLYFTRGSYEPLPGDLIFFDTHHDGTSNHVGLVVEVDGDKVKTIEGNSADTVRYDSYALTDTRIMGYGQLIPLQKEEEQAPVITYLCGLEEHAHAENCYDADGNLICSLEEHVHSDACLEAAEEIEEITYLCGLEEHTHGEDCYDAEGNLICQLPEHTHAPVCLEAAEEIEEITYLCGLEEHIHGEDCYDAEGNLICELTEHTHSDACLEAPAEEEINPYLCGLIAHVHTEDCYDNKGNLKCGMEEHTHTEACLSRTLFYTDGNLRATVAIKGVTELPEDLNVLVWQITAEEEPDAYDAMHNALVDKMNKKDQYLSSAHYYGMQLMSEGAVYELAETAEISVSVEFVDPIFDHQTMKNAAKLETFLLTPEMEEPAAEEAVEAPEADLMVTTFSVSDDAMLSAASDAAEEPQEPVSYQADAVEDEDYTNQDQGLTAVSFQTKSIATFAVAVTSDTVEGTYWTRVNTASDITSGGTYMIVSAEGGYALTGNNSSNYQAVVYQKVKGDANNYYTITNSDSANLRWTITKSGNYYTVQNQGTSNYLNMSRDNRIVYSSSANLTIAAANDTANCMRIANGSYYLYNAGGSFGRKTGNDGTYTRNNVSTVVNNTKDMVIFKLSSVTSLDIPRDVSADSGGSDGSGQTGPAKPDYGAFITPSDKKTGDTAVTEDTVTVSGQYYSDPATSDLESEFRKNTYAESEAIDGKVMSDKSVIYGDDDYDAFDTYAANTFGVTLSALGQEYPVPQSDVVRTPIDVVYVLDVSGSMSDSFTSGGVTTTRAQALASAVNTSMAQILGDHDANRVGMVIYSSGAWEMLPLDRYTATDNQYLTCVTKTVNTSNGYSVSAKVIQGSASLKNDDGQSYAGAGGNESQGVGTYTQAGIALGRKVFNDIGTDTTYTATIGTGDNAREYTVKRQPVFILVSDGEPTHSTNNYADVLKGPHYGNGVSTGNTNGKGIHGYNTVLSANYYKRMIGIQYKKPALFYTIGMGIHESEDGPLVTTSGTGDNYKRAVLNPTSTTIAASSNKYQSDTIDMLESMLNGTYANQFVTTSYQWPDEWYGVPHEDIPVVSPNPYAGNYSYTDQAYFGQLSTSDLEEIFSKILASSTIDIPYGFVLYRNTAVQMQDLIGEGMEVKGTPVLRYGGKNYTDPTVAVNGNVTTYTYKGTFEDPYIEDRVIDLSDIKVTVTTDDYGMQTVELDIPDSALPTYTPELIGKQYYYESLPVRLIYQVGLTEESEQAVLDLAKTGGELTYYTNSFISLAVGDGTNVISDAVTYLLPSEANPFYHDQDTSDNVAIGYHAHHDLKTDNTTDTADYSTDCRWDEDAPDDTYRVIHHLGNNGKLVFAAEAPKLEVPVEKQWVNVVDSSNLSVDVTLYTVKETTAEGGAVTKEILESQSMTLNAENTFKHTFTQLPELAEGTYYAIAEAVPGGFVASYAGGELVDLPGENGASIQAVKVNFADGETVATPIVITNAPLVELPETGGPGTILYTAGGLLLMMAATLLLLHNNPRKRRKEGQSSF